MSETKERNLITFEEDPAIIERLDAMAQAEGTKRSALIRRALRILLFSTPSFPTFEKSPKVEEPAEAAA
jgi:hypothetical protein